MLEAIAFAQSLRALCEIFGVEMTPARVELYYLVLQELDIEAWKRAIARALRELKFFPKPAELIELAQEQKPDDRVLLAWEELRTALARIGCHQSVDFEDKIINAAVRGMGGWMRLGQMDAEEFAVWGRKEFERHYAAFARQLPAELAAPLAGHIEAHNGGKGYAFPGPVKVAAMSAVPTPQVTMNTTAIAAVASVTSLVAHRPAAGQSAPEIAGRAVRHAGNKGPCLRVARLRRRRPIPGQLSLCIAEED